MTVIEFDINKIEALNARLLRGMEEERTRTAVPDGFPELPRIPGGRYNDPVFWEAEMQAIWKRAWLYACHEDQLPEIGSYLQWEKTGSPLFLVRGDDNKIRAFYNTCSHRGAPVLDEPAGKVRGMTCRYHGWTYNLQGDLVNLREKRDFPVMDMSCHGLTPVRCEQLGKWVFISEDPGAQPLIEYLGPVAEQMMQFQPDNLVYVDSHGFDLDCNIKVLLDAFFETYHLKSIHPDTVDRFLDHRGTTVALWENGHSIMCTPNRRPDWVDPGTIGMPHIETVSAVPREQNTSFHIFPNWVAPPHSTGIPLVLFWPISINKMRVEAHWFAPSWGDGPRPELWDTRIANFDRILFEDTQFAPHIQKSVESPGFKGMYLSYQERRIYHWHEELDRRIEDAGIAVPEELKVKPLMRDYWE